MSKIIPLLLHVESIAFGEALLKIHAMPGVVRYEIPLGHGGEGAGRKQLEKAAAAKASDNGQSRERTIAVLLATGPKHIREISAALGGKKARAYGIMTALRKKQIAESMGGAMWQLTKRARAHVEAAAPATTAALPAPTEGPHHALRAILATGPARTGAIKMRLAEFGLSPKSIPGVINRGKRDGIIRSNGEGYELTAKGNKLNAGAAHG